MALLVEVTRARVAQYYFAGAVMTSRGSRIRVWRRAGAKKPTQPAHHATYFPRDPLGTRAMLAWRDWRSTLTPS
jgi:hypothetical protein